MKQVQYARYEFGTGAEKPFTADELRRNIHLLYVDLECPECGLVIALSNYQQNPNQEELQCPRCGKY